MIDLRNITKSFHGKTILNGVNLKVEKGETVVIIGGSGTGKSVTIKHITGLIEPDKGEVWINGEKITGSSLRKVRASRRKMGVLFQSGALMNWMTIEQNVALPLFEKTRLKKNEINAIVEEKLRMVDLFEARHKFPAEISGGMKKRAGLARALATHPEIILCDEPTSGLDPVMSNIIDQLLLKLQKELGVTTIVVTHDMTSAYRIANRIAMLYQGKIIEFDTPERIRNSINPIVRQFIHGATEGPITANR